MDKEDFIYDLKYFNNIEEATDYLNEYHIHKDDIIDLQYHPNAVFDLTDMIVEELYRKNGIMFFIEYTSKFPAWNDYPEWRELADCVKE